MQKRRSFYGKKYKSGDVLVDWIFRRFVEILNKKVDLIVLKRRLRDEKGKLLDGQWKKENKTIYINPARYSPACGSRKDYDMLVTLVHELSHILFEPAREREILQAERMLIQKLSDSQKRALRGFIPKDDGV